MTGARDWILRLSVVAACMVAGSVCSGAQDESSRLPEVPQTDLTGVDAPVAEQIRAAQASLAATLSHTDASSTQRAEAFGSLGQMYQAYGLDRAALTYYANAARLDPQSFRWPYYLGYLHQMNGDAETAVREYQQALTLDPANTPALLRLGNLELTLGHPGEARQRFTQAMAQRSSAAALTGLGKVALLERDYEAALKNFTLALAREPQASSIHYQLAMVYRGLGDLPHMQEQLRARGNAEPVIQDPLLDEITVLKQGKSGLMERGSTAMLENRIADAIAIYSRMVRLYPSEPLAYTYLASVLARSGKIEEALQQYAHALRLNPGNAVVYCNLGILLIRAGKEEQAIAHFQRALQLDSGLVTAHFQLANVLMRQRKDAEAEREYGIVVSLEPQNRFARLMQAMAAVRSKSYARARTLLEEAAVAFSRDSDIASALARLLAGAPDPTVRDPTRALRIVKSLLENPEADSLENGITLAMAFAAAGRFREAAKCQDAIIKQLEASRQSDLARPLRQDLARYQQGKPCRTPWDSDDPIFTPVPGEVPLPVEAKTMAVPH